MSRRFWLLGLALLITLPGCGPRPVTGGTAGVLRFSNQVLSDIQVTVHRVEGTSAQPLGFGVTDMQGNFKLMTNGAQGPLWLPPGEYRVTLDTAGAPVQFPPEYLKPESTPLKVTRSATDGDLTLNAPIELQVR